MNKIINYTIKKLDNHQKKVKKAVIKLKYLKYQNEFGEQDDDIYIVTYPKSGTTLMQMILYQLTTDGNMDFEHIYDVPPWIKNDSLLGIPPRKLKSPRLIKSHDLYKEFPATTKEKFIYIHRDGKDCAVSNWYQEINYRTTDLEFEKYILKFLNKQYNWFTFTMDWFENKRNLPILYLHYEDLINKFEYSINKVVNFLQLSSENIDMKRVYNRTRIEFMKKYETKFGDKPSKADKIYTEFIRKGKTGEGKKKFPENFSKAFDIAYKKNILPIENKISF